MVTMSCINLFVVAVILLNLYIIKARNESKYFSLNNNLIQITSRIKRQTEDDCFLPNHPANGELKIVEDSKQSYSPNSRVVERTIIDLSCEEGYATKTGGLARAICYRGAWTPAISKMGGCARTSTPVTSSVITPRVRDCIFPPHPPNGEFKVLIQNYIYLPNSTSHQIAIMRLDCTNGYVPESDNSLAFCSAGQWTPDLSLIGGCMRTCSSIKANTDSYTVKCMYTNYEVPCESPKEGTRADVDCKPYFEYTANRPIIECKNGSWNNDISPCTPECGRIRVVYPLSEHGGRRALLYEFPWLARIYRYIDDKFLCRGSIISRYYVLTAAHCFATRNESDYLIAAGKYYEYLADPRDGHKQIVKIKEMYIPEYYKGMDQNYAFDYAVLKLQQPFVLSRAVQPVCVDWNNKYEGIEDLENDKKGVLVVAGWGFTPLGTPLSDQLYKLIVQFRHRTTCEKYLPKDFVAKYYTFDKHCAGFIDNYTNVCEGDSGGGLYFPEYDDRFFVRGIVSVGPNRENNCDSNRFALYTKVSTHVKDIEKITDREV